MRQQGGTRILALVSDGYGAGGGIARYNAALFKALSLSDRVAEIVVLARHGDVHSPRPAKVRQQVAIRGRLAWAIAACRLGLSERFDAIFCGHLNMLSLAAMLSAVGRAPLWLQLHGIEAWKRPGAAARHAARRASLVTAVSRYTRRQFLRWSSVPTHRVRVLPNCMTEGLTPQGRREAIRARHGVAGNRLILTVGRLSANERYKGHDRVIDALPAVIRRHPDATYLIVGDGDDTARLKSRAAKVGVGERVIFAGGVAQSELPDYFAMADVFAMPSKGEGFGIVFLEAAACGLPVIAGNGDGSADALVDGVLGTLVDPDDGEGLCDALSAALDGHIPAADPGELARFDADNFTAHVDKLVAGLGISPGSGMAPFRGDGSWR